MDTRRAQVTISGERAPFDLDHPDRRSHNVPAASASRGPLPEHIWIRCIDRSTIQRKLRISLVDKCNLSCFFCHNEGQGAIKQASTLSLGVTALETIVRAAANEGVNKIKLTGGEPLLYKNSTGDILDVVSRIANLRHDTPPFDLSMTTNGTMLPHMASRLAAAGLDRITVSLTTTRSAIFGEFISAKTHLLGRMLDGIDEARAAGLRPVKLNVPLYYSSVRRIGNLHELDPLIGFASRHGVSEVRFFTLISHNNFPDFDQYYHFFSPDMRSALAQCLSHYGWESPTDTVESLARLGSAFASRMYPKVEFGINIGRVQVRLRGHEARPTGNRTWAAGGPLRDASRRGWFVAINVEQHAELSVDRRCKSRRLGREAPRNISGRSRGDAVSPSTLRVGTWNILGRQHDEQLGPADDGAIRRTLAKAAVDVLCLQEVHFYDGQADQQLRAELRMAGLEHFVGEPLSPSHLDADAQLGVCISARFPLRNKHAHKLNNPGLRATVRGKNWHLHDKGIVGADLDLGYDRSVKVHSLHLFPFFEFGVDDTDDYVEKMWSELWAYADQASESAKVILAGDYNQARRADAAKTWSDLDWNFCVPDVVTTTIGLSLDDIAINWAHPCAGHRVVSTFSDHHLVIADLVL